MLSVVVQNPSPQGVRRLVNQTWTLTDEILVSASPGSEGELAWRLARDAGAFGSAATRLFSEPVEKTNPTWDWAIQGIQEAKADWVWLLPQGAVAFPTAIQAIREALEGTIVPQLFYAYGPTRNIIPRADRALPYGPREVYAPCLVVPRDRKAKFESGSWGDVAWINEIALAGHRLNSKMVAGRETDSIFIEKWDGERWVFYAAPNSTIQQTAEPIGFLKGRILTLVPTWREKGFFVPLVRFAMQVAAGGPIELDLPDCRRDRIGTTMYPAQKKDIALHQILYRLGFTDDTDIDHVCRVRHPGLLHA